MFHDRGTFEEGVSKDVTGGSFSSGPGEDPVFYLRMRLFLLLLSLRFVLSR